MNTIFTVTQLNRAVNDRLSNDPELGKIRVRGEISGYKKYPSGHAYFTLKDENASVSCVLFRRPSHQAPDQMREGIQVVLFARTNLYDKTGRFQLIVDSVEEEGVGDLFARFLKLKQTLADDGLFDERKKKAIPYIPDRIVIITSQAGAVIRDIIHVLRRRFPGIRAVLIPVPVQGAGAEFEIAAALELANHLRLGDVIIVGRGGGSLEDLQPFNEEVTARAIAASLIPVISAVGHETDFTIADFVSDLRAPTPSVAAELVVPVKDSLLLRLDQLASSLEMAMTIRLSAAADRIRELASRPVLARPVAIIEHHESRNELLRHRLRAAYRRCLTGEESRISGLEGRYRRAMDKKMDERYYGCERAMKSLEALSPLAVLSRGYALVTDESGRMVTQGALLAKGDVIDLVFSDGEVGCEVTQALQERSDHAR
ncbi:MAG TPA: exodeoxyribonuclease VII large subunit [Clostridia bacterium]|nr:exodeoxyribonuclease VII large subunit [Clostridia bacterium]